jgi:hypothetical protein
MKRMLYFKMTPPPSDEESDHDKESIDVDAPTQLSQVTPNNSISPLCCLPPLSPLPSPCRPCPLCHVLPLLVDCCFQSLPQTGGVLDSHLPLLFSGQKTCPTLPGHSLMMPLPSLPPGRAHQQLPWALAQTELLSPPLRAQQ